MSYVNDLKFQKRRPSKRYLTPEELLIEANRVIDDANQAIARQIAHAQAWQAVAAALDTENRELRSQVAELERENTRLRKLVRPKAGKKRDEWEEVS